jgi:Glycosyltransferase family 87
VPFDHGDIEDLPRSPPESLGRTTEQLGVDGPRPYTALSIERTGMSLGRHQSLTNIQAQGRCQVSQGPRPWRHAVLSTLLVAITTLLIGQHTPDPFFDGHNDFLQLYVGSVLAGSPSLYSFDANTKLQLQRTGVSIKSVYYSRLPFYAALLSPLAKLSYARAYWTFQALSILSYALFVLTFLSAYPRYSVWAPLFLPLVLNFLIGQDVVITVLLAALFVVFSGKGHDILAGGFLSLCLIKFHLFVFVPMVLFVHGRRRIFWSAAAGAIVCMIISFAANGADWPIRYASALMSPELSPHPEQMPTVVGFLRSIGAGTAAAPVFVGAILLMCWATRQSSDFKGDIGLALLLGLIISPHAYMQDCCLLLLVSPLVSKDCRSALCRAVQVCLFTPVPYLLLYHGLPARACLPLLLLLFLFGICWQRERDRNAKMTASLGVVSSV